MGDHFQTVVDVDATADEARALAARVVEWLVAEGIVLGERTDCVLGQPLGHPPGPNWQRAVEESPDWDPWDGLAVHTERTVFDSGQGGPESVTCPRCETTAPLSGETYDEDYEPSGEGPAGEADLDPDSGEGEGEAENSVWPRFAAAMGTWHETGAATVDCPACARPVALTDWIWEDDHYAFGHLGLEFWNWPELRPDFIQDISRLLDGHRTVHVWGKL
ncbi:MULTISPECIES: hypothetical protein [unclassified Streptomyces]|uniref:hypothetical protein n=1 Tax=unclassified Streptomyces TaxID=2593676 RepID=UPI00365CF832